MSVKEIGAAARRFGGWTPPIRFRMLLTWAKASRRLVWLPVITLAVICRAPSECYAAIITVATATAVPEIGTSAHD